MTALAKTREFSPEFSIVMSAKVGKIDQLYHDVAPYLENLGFHDLLFNIELGIREALANAVEHGSRNDPREKVVIQIAHEHNRLFIKIIDDGFGFDHSPKEKKQGNAFDWSVPLLCRGRGLMIMEHCFDQVIFNEQGNEVTLVIELGESKGGAKQ